MSVLPLAKLEDVDPVGELGTRNRRLRAVVEALSRRRDTRALRARMLLLLLELRCPEYGAPNQPWYVPGAVARLSIEDLGERIQARFGVKSPCTRTLRRHLRALERGGAVVRMPGEPLGYAPDRENPERVPRFPDTILILSTELQARWWAEVGHYRLAEHPSARRSLRAWRAVFSKWRTEARDRLPFHVEQSKQTPPSPEGIRRALRADRLEELLADLRAAGVHMSARATWHLARYPSRLKGAAAMLAGALERGDPIRNAAGWLVQAFRRAPREEIDRAAAFAGVVA